jgi:hypothetical protein
MDRVHKQEGSRKSDACSFKKKPSWLMSVHHEIFLVSPLPLLSENLSKLIGHKKGGRRAAGHEIWEMPVLVLAFADWNQDLRRSLGQDRFWTHADLNFWKPA